MTDESPRRRATHLVDELLANAVEPAYAEDAARRRCTRHGSAGWSDPLRWSYLLVLVVIGLVVAVGYQSLRPLEAASSPRTELAERLQERQAVQQEQAAQVVREREAVEALQQRVLAGGGHENLSRQYAEWSEAAGATTVRGDGVVVELDDPRGTDPENRVIAADLQRVVNTLWASGAEAITINGHRLSSMAGIRFAGEAIVVDFRALQRPYRIEAVGPAELPDRFRQGGGDDQLADLREEYEFRASWSAASGLELPPDPTLTLHHARPITVETP